MSAPPVTVVQGPALARRIAELRADRSIDVMEALRSEAPDEQQLLDELGAMLDLPVLREAELIDSQALFDQLPFAECARRRCALLRRPGSEAVHLVASDPFDTDSLAWARTRFGALTPALASNASLGRLARALRRDADGARQPGVRRWRARCRGPAPARRTAEPAPHRRR